MDLQYGDLGYSTCVMQTWSLMKRQRRGVFLPQKIKVARNCLKWIDLMSKNFPHPGGGGFPATKTKVAQNCLKWIDLMSENVPSSWGGGGLFCPIFRIHYFQPGIIPQGPTLFQIAKKSFVSYSVNDIQAYKNNILMTLQSCLGSKVTVIAEILVCIVVGLPIGLPYAP